MNKANASDAIKIPINFPSSEEAELNYVLKAMRSGHRHGAGPFTKQATALIQSITGANKVILSHSCTGALEMSMLLLDIGIDDEVILPSYTFSSTANAVVLRGAIPVFADIDPYTQCIDPTSVEKLITSRTRAIMPVHYAGIGCDMNALLAIANRHGLKIVEDAAQAIGCTRSGKALGCFGQLGAFSFHDSKNLSCGEGGALLINDNSYVTRAEILWEKGTNRSQFLRGEVDKYTWVDVGSSFLPSDVTAAFLLGQLERMEQINSARLLVWDRYFSGFAELEARGICRRPYVPADCKHNGHIFYLMMNNAEERDELMAYLRAKGICALFHYVPLHDSPAGKRYGRAPLPLPHTVKAGQCLLRFPVYPQLTLEQQEWVISEVNGFFVNECTRGMQTSISS